MPMKVSSRPYPLLCSQLLMKSINFRANFSQRRLERRRIIARSGRSPGYAPWLTSQSSAARGCPTRTTCRRGSQWCFSLWRPGGTTSWSIWKPWRASAQWRASRTCSSDPYLLRFFLGCRGFGTVREVMAMETSRLSRVWSSQILVCVRLDPRTTFIVIRLS